MNVVVCVKVVDGELNPFDECALEEALKLDNADITVVSMGPRSIYDKLLSLTRYGVKKVVLISDKIYAGSDTLATSYILSEYIKTQKFDAVFCGRQTVDGDTAQVGPSLAAMLGVPFITNVLKLETINGEFRCETRFGSEVGKAPVLLTVERINKLRFFSIRSKVGSVEIIDNSVLKLKEERCGLLGSPTKVLKTYENNEGVRSCKFISPCDFFDVLDKSLNNVKETVNFKESEKKLKNVWAIGDAVSKKARIISDDVTVIYEKSPQKLYEMILDKKPGTVLWNADIYGRRYAPYITGLLKTGLCADCTHLETDGEKLYMFRPARGGNIIAKIETITRPQCATVRCESNSNNIIVSGGRGVINEFDKLESFAERINASVCSSRPVVDEGVVQYESQVGLTGKNVSPQVYIAVGISGAVQHICAVQNSGTIIAINPDKSSDIFKYCDYGIVSTFENFLLTLKSQDDII